MNIQDYKDIIFENKIKGWNNMSPLEKLITYREHAKDIPHCDSRDEVMHQYEEYDWCKKKGLKLYKKVTKYGIINELRNEDGLVMKGDTMTSPWTIVKEFAKFDSQSENPNFFKEEFNGWCDRINKAYKDNSLTYLQKLLLQFISLAHTPGNFCIVPKMFNVGRSGKFAANDKWDLTLNTIEKWYESRDDEVLKKMLESKYDDLKLEKAIKFAKDWLKSFSDFEEFCKLNYFQDYLNSYNESKPATEPLYRKFVDTTNAEIQGGDWKLIESAWGEFLWKINHCIISRYERLVEEEIVDDISIINYSNLRAEQFEEALYRLENFTDLSDWNLDLQKFLEMKSIPVYKENFLDDLVKEFLSTICSDDLQKMIEIEEFESENSAFVYYCIEPEYISPLYFCLFVSKDKDNWKNERKELKSENKSIVILGNKDGKPRYAKIKFDFKTGELDYDGLGEK